MKLSDAFPGKNFLFRMLICTERHPCQRLIVPVIRRIANTPDIQCRFFIRGIDLIPDKIWTFHTKFISIFIKQAGIRSAKNNACPITPFFQAKRALQHKNTEIFRAQIVLRRTDPFCSFPGAMIFFFQGFRIHQARLKTCLCHACLSMVVRNRDTDIISRTGRQHRAIQGNSGRIRGP